MLSCDGNPHLHCRIHCCPYLFFMCSDGKVVKIPEIMSCVLALFLIWIWRMTWHGNNGSLALTALQRHRKPFQWHWVNDNIERQWSVHTGYLVHCIAFASTVDFFLLWHGNSGQCFELQWTVQCLKLLLLQIYGFLEHVCSTMPVAGSSG